MSRLRQPRIRQAAERTVGSYGAGGETAYLVRLSAVECTSVRTGMLSASVIAPGFEVEQDVWRR